MDTKTLKTPEEALAASMLLVTEVKDIAGKAETEGRDFSPEERLTVKSKLDEAHAAKARHDELKAADDDAGLKAKTDSLALALAGHAIDLKNAIKAPDAPGKSAGARFTDSPEVTEWLKTAGVQSSSKSRVGTSPAVLFSGIKDIITGLDPTQGGALVQEDWRGLVDQGLYQRPLVIRDLVSSGNTTSDTVSYAREVSVTNNAAPVPEAAGTSAGDATADVSGLKPESELELEKVETTVKTIAHWIPATKRALSDAAQIRTLIDTFLRYGLEEELENQIVNGDGTGENFEGILNVDGTQALGAAGINASDVGAAGPLAGIVALRIAKRLVRTVGRASANAIVLNPEDNERIDLARDLNGNFYFGGPAGVGPQTAWGLPRVESEALEPGTAVVADWKRAVLWDREQASIAVSDSHADFFVRNLVAILAELRAAFGVFRPKAFVIVDMAAAFAMT